MGRKNKQPILRKSSRTRDVDKETPDQRNRVRMAKRRAVETEGESVQRLKGVRVRVAKKKHFMKQYT